MLLERLNAEIKEAMLNKDTEKRDVLRAIKSNATLIAKEKHVDIADEFVLDAIKKEIKQLNQTLNSLTGKEDTDLFKGTAYRIKVLEAYMPKQMTEDEIREAVRNIIANLGENVAFGVKMGAVMKELKGKADGKLIQKIVKEA